MSTEASRLLHKEAQLVDHFCLGNMPVVRGKAAIPMEWEKALGSIIRLREGVGEATSDAPELMPFIEDIRKLGPGESVIAKPSTGTAPRHVLAYRSQFMPQQLLVLIKTDHSLHSSVGSDLPLSPLIIAMLSGIIAALVHTFIMALIFRR